MNKQLAPIIGNDVLAVWNDFAGRIMALYAPEITFKENPKWEPGKSGGLYELKFIKGGKTLCAFYARPKQFGFMLIFGRGEQAAFEESRSQFPKRVQAVYDESLTYLDGKWMMFPVSNGRDIDAFIKLLAIKRKPIKKGV
jgi:hypothetical protein